MVKRMKLTDKEIKQLISVIVLIIFCIIVYRYLSLSKNNKKESFETNNNENNTPYGVYNLRQWYEEKKYPTFAPTIKHSIEHKLPVGILNTDINLSNDNQLRFGNTKDNVGNSDQFYYFQPKPKRGNIGRHLRLHMDEKADDSQANAFQIWGQGHATNNKRDGEGIMLHNFDSKGNSTHVGDVYSQKNVNGDVVNVRNRLIFNKSAGTGQNLLNNSEDDMYMEKVSTGGSGQALRMTVNSDASDSFQIYGKGGFRPPSKLFEVSGDGKAEIKESLKIKNRNVLDEIDSNSRSTSISLSALNSLYDTQSTKITNLENKIKALEVSQNNSVSKEQLKKLREKLIHFVVEFTGPMREVSTSNTAYLAHIDKSIKDTNNYRAFKVAYNKTTLDDIGKKISNDVETIKNKMGSFFV